MSSGNPYGLAEISHFGSFQHVGGKAGGFINKKFFHPSSINNQEKLWKAMDADAKLEREQNELQKRRDEERQIEDLRKQMYLSGQGKACDVGSSASTEEAKDDIGLKDKKEQHAAHEEFKRRRAALKQERASREHADNDEPADSDVARVAARPLAKSTLYQEDEHVLGHSQVWGSWFTAAEDGKSNGHWGFACCKAVSRNAECPVAQAEEEAAKREAEIAEAQDGPRAAKRKRKLEVEASEQEGLVAAGSSDSAADAPGCGAAAKVPSAEPIVDTRMLEAAERRKEKKRKEDEAKEKKENKTSDYLADLLGDPTACM